MNKIKIECECDKEAEVFYKMYLVTGTPIVDSEWTSMTCCNDKPATIKVTNSGKTLSIYYNDNTVSTYTHH